MGELSNSFSAAYPMCAVVSMSARLLLLDSLRSQSFFPCQYPWKILGPLQAPRAMAIAWPQAPIPFIIVSMLMCWQRFKLCQLAPTQSRHPSTLHRRARTQQSSYALCTQQTIWMRPLCFGGEESSAHDHKLCPAIGARGRERPSLIIFATTDTETSVGWIWAPHQKKEQ